MSCHQTVLAFLLISTISKAAGDCGIPFDGSNDISLVQPHGQTKVAQGHVLQYICQPGYELTEGSLTLGCTSTNTLNETMPACNRPDFLTGDSNDVELRNREHTIEEYFAYTSVGTSLAIERQGVIKQWKFYSRQKGFVFFQVWRPIHQRDKNSFNIVGQNQVETSGPGEETYDLEEADWITVQPGDRIGLSEPKEHRGDVPYSTCTKDTQPEDFGVTKAFASRGDFSYSCAHTFSSDPECMEFSFKAVIHPPMSLPDKPDLPTSSVALVSGYDVDLRKTVFLGDSSNFYIPVDGCVKEWQFYAIHGGAGFFQVWRRVGAIGEWRYKLIGQNAVERHYNDEGLFKLKVEEKERIAVKAGDIIGFLFGNSPMGIPYSMCDASFYPDSTNVSWFRPKTADSIVADGVYDFKPVSSPCRILRFRAIVKQACDRPDDLHTSDVDLVSRPYRGYTKTAYVGNSTNFYIPANGYVKEWQYFSKHGGIGAFQVWRGTQNKLRYELIGQNDINLTSQAAAPYRFSVKEAERIYVKKGDSIGFLFGGEMTGIPYSRCQSQREKDRNNNVGWLYPVIPEEMLAGQMYNFSLGTDKSLFCRVFSLRAVIEQVSDRPDDVYTGDVAIIKRPHGGYHTTTYLGDSSNFYIPANGSVKEWQFFGHPGHGAFQVWRRVDAAAKKYKLIGQNMVTLTSDRVGRHRLRVEEAERIAVRKGDIIGVHYGAEGSKLGLPYSLCSGAEEKETNNKIHWFWPAVPEDMEVGRPYTFTYSGQYPCRVFSVRAVIEQEPYGTS